MAIKKSELYSSLWQSCDELRGGMDASQYKDYVLVMLFIKYVSDKYAGQAYAPITIPRGASFKNMVGGELTNYTELLIESRREAMRRMIAQAEQLEANAILNVRFATSSIAQGAAELYVYGTAAIIEKIEE